MQKGPTKKEDEILRKKAEIYIRNRVLKYINTGLRILFLINIANEDVFLSDKTLTHDQIRNVIELSISIIFRNNFSNFGEEKNIVSIIDKNTRETVHKGIDKSKIYTIDDLKKSYFSKYELTKMFSFNSLGGRQWSFSISEVRKKAYLNFLEMMKSSIGSSIYDTSKLLMKYHSQFEWKEKELERFRKNETKIVSPIEKLHVDYKTLQIFYNIHYLSKTIPGIGSGYHTMFFINKFFDFVVKPNLSTDSTSMISFDISIDANPYIKIEDKDMEKAYLRGHFQMKYSKLMEDSLYTHHPRVKIVSQDKTTTSQWDPISSYSDVEHQINVKYTNMKLKKAEELGYDDVNAVMLLNANSVLAMINLIPEAFDGNGIGFMHQFWFCYSIYMMYTMGYVTTHIINKKYEGNQPDFQYEAEDFVIRKRMCDTFRNYMLEKFLRMYHSKEDKIQSVAYGIIKELFSVHDGVRNKITKVKSLKSLLELKDDIMVSMLLSFTSKDKYGVNGKSVIMAFFENNVNTTKKVSSDVSTLIRKLISYVNEYFDKYTRIGSHNEVVERHMKYVKSHNNDLYFSVMRDVIKLLGPPLTKSNTSTNFNIVVSDRDIVFIKTIGSLMIQI